MSSNKHVQSLETTTPILLRVDAASSVSGDASNNSSPFVGTFIDGVAQRAFVSTTEHDPPAKVGTDHSTRQRSLRSAGQAPEKLSNKELKAQVMEREILHEPFGICPCTSYGPDREQRFPHFWFCHQCSLWDIEACANNLSHISSVSRVFKCKAKHKLHSLLPAHPKKVHFTLRGEKCNKETEDKAFSDHADDDSTAEGSGEEYNNYNEEYNFLDNSDKDMLFSDYEQLLLYQRESFLQNKNIAMPCVLNNTVLLQRDRTVNQPQILDLQNEFPMYLPYPKLKNTNQNRNKL